MRIRSLRIEGFRGFNDVRELEFSDALTLIYGANSHGKTSITEALEWLLFGVTSRVDSAQSKTEYRDSYRNRHFPPDSRPSVTAVFGTEEDTALEFRAYLLADDEQERYVDNERVNEWPHVSNTAETGRPFVVQHALQDLLLAGPSERFRKLTLILGLEGLEVVQKHIHSLCTKPTANLPTTVSGFLADVSLLENRLRDEPGLASIQGIYEEGLARSDEFWRAVEQEALKRLPDDAPPVDVLPQLKLQQATSRSAFFGGSVTLPQFSDRDTQADQTDREQLRQLGSEAFIAAYMGLATTAVIAKIKERANFMDVGVRMLADAPNKCPFCGQTIGASVKDHIAEEHQAVCEQVQQHRETMEARAAVLQQLADWRTCLQRHFRRHTSRTQGLLDAESQIDDIGEILRDDHAEQCAAITQAMGKVRTAVDLLEDTKKKLLNSLDALVSSVDQDCEEQQLMEAAGEALVAYLEQTEVFSTVVDKWVEPMSSADIALKQELDAQVGITALTVLVDLLSRRDDLLKKQKIDDILQGVKGLRQTVDDYVHSKIHELVTEELTRDVMDWYELIRTQGDPDVHFAGFELPRNKDGTFKSRTIGIEASSYGQELASAVSSLSESRLNALGLCLSLANAVRDESPFRFVLIDDPIQSWDSAHASQFVRVVLKLVEDGWQVVVLSHNEGWVRELRAGCRSVNGVYYEITGYDASGPHLVQHPWCKTRERLNEIGATLDDPTASVVALRHAEGELRMVFSELACGLHEGPKPFCKDPAKVNAAGIRKLLAKKGVRPDLVDRVGQAFTAVDDAHHDPSSYAPDRERIRRYAGWACELRNALQIDTT